VRAQFHELRSLLDTFGRRFDAERLRQFGNRAHDRARTVAGQQILDEASVDLQFVEREALQVAQRRIARAEIIQCNPDPEFA